MSTIMIFFMLISMLAQKFRSFYLRHDYLTPKLSTSMQWLPNCRSKFWCKCTFVWQNFCLLSRHSVEITKVYLHTTLLTKISGKQRFYQKSCKRVEFTNYFFMWEWNFRFFTLWQKPGIMKYQNIKSYFMLWKPL